MQRRLMVLVSAYACEPGKGSEEGQGWNWVCEIARFHEVWVITRVNNRQPIESALGRKPIPNVHFVYFDLPRWSRFWKKGERGVHLYYYLWQLGCYSVAKKLNRQVGFDLGHHVTFAICWMPSFLALLPMPFVWGPVGGGDSTPRGFWHAYSFKGKIYEIVRDLARIFSRLDPFVRLTCQRTVCALAATRKTEELLRGLGSQEVSVHPMSGLSQDEIQRLNRFPLRHGAPFRVLSTGRFLHWKGFELGLTAFALLHREFPECEYWLIGDGPERNRLKRLAEKLKLAEAVHFWGRMDRPHALEKLAECDVLLHPSLHDSYPWVCIEAMAAGRPVICLDVGGPALQVSEETGIKVAVTTPEHSVAGLSAALVRLAKDPDLRHRMSQAARKRVGEDFEWNRLGDRLMAVYETHLPPARVPRIHSD